MRINDYIIFNSTEFKSGVLICVLVKEEINKPEIVKTEIE